MTHPERIGKHPTAERAPLLLPGAARAEFPILENATYLNSCSMGALSLRAEAYLDEFRASWHTLGASAWYELWMGRIDDLRAQVAGSLGAHTGEIALLPSTSAALSVVSEAVPRGKRNRVVCTELDFPTLVYQWRVKPEIEVVMLRSEDGVGIDPAQFDEVVDERTLFLATSHVYFSTGFIQDIRALGEIARRAGAFSLIDGYQAPGQIPVDLHESGVDLYTAGPLKWLCGGPGLGYLFVREEVIQQLRPRITSWFASKDQFSFDLDGFEYHDDARRFELGTPALPTVHTALGGQEIIDEVGIVAIRKHNRELAAYVVQEAESRALEVTMAKDPERRSALVMIRHTDPQAVVAHLARQRVIVDYRPGHVRVSPHFYNLADEVDTFFRALDTFPS